MLQYATLLIWLALAPVWAAPPHDISDEHGRILTIGAIDEDLEGHYGKLRPIADYIAIALAPHGVVRVDIRIVEDRRRLARMMRDSRIDWVSANASITVYLQEIAGAEILARKWKQGVPQIRSVFFTRADSGIASLAQLDGRLLALLQPESTTGHFLPVAELLRNGKRAVNLNNVRQELPEKAVGYAFAGSDFNASTWVHKRIADAGVLSNVNWESSDSMPTSFRKDFIIFHQTDPLPHALELVRSDLDADLKTALKTALLDMDEDSNAAAALQAYQGTLRFDELDTTDWAVMTELRDTFAQLMFVN